jgi:hypothetical protein
MVVAVLVAVGVLALQLRHTITDAAIGSTIGWQEHSKVNQERVIVGVGWLKWYDGELRYPGACTMMPLFLLLLVIVVVATLCCLVVVAVVVVIGICVCCLCVGCC